MSRDVRCQYVLQFRSKEDVKQFLRVLEYAEHGRVIVDWETEEHDDDYDTVIPVYDEQPMDDDPWYPLCRALSDFAFAFISNSLLDDVGTTVRLIGRTVNEGLVIDEMYRSSSLLDFDFDVVDL